MSYITFKNKWIGKRVDYDKVYGYQCVDLIKQYMAEEKGLKPGAWGNAIDYWYNTNVTVLKHYDKIATNDLRAGDIVILKGVNGNPYGHIGIASGASYPWYRQILEQNGSTGNGSGVGGDAIRERYVPTYRILGILRPKTAQPNLVMPAIGSKIKVSVTRTTFKPGTTTKAGVINPPATGWIYTVRGYDPVYGGRVIINSASGGGDGVALALYYTNGVRIDGWSKA
jgi:hypothetical protein